MPIASDQKAHERWFAESALELLGISASLRDSESPDFLADLNGEVIGIEVMEYSRGQDTGESLHRRQEHVWQLVMTQAQDRFSEDHQVNLRVSAIWIETSVPASVQSHQLADRFAKLIAACLLRLDQSNVRLEFHELREFSLEQQVMSVLVQKLPANEQSLWVIATGGPNDLLPTELQQLVKMKDAKAVTYRKKCAKLWLLIAAAGNSHATGFSTHTGVLDQTYVSTFDRVLLYDDFKHTILEVRLE